MKFAQQFKKSLAAEGYPQKWVDSAIPYGQLKKCLNKVTKELQDLGLDKDTLSCLASSSGLADGHTDAVHHSDQGFRYLLQGDAADPKHIRPRLTVFVHLREGVVIDAGLTPSTRQFLQNIASASSDSPPISPLDLNDVDPLTSPISSSASSLEPCSPGFPCEFHCGDLTGSRERGPSTQCVEIPLVFDGEFFDILQTDVSNLDNLQREEQGHLSKKIEGLGGDLRRVTKPSRAHRKDKAAWREIFQLYLEASVFFSTRECDHGARTSEQAVDRLRWFQDQVLAKKLVEGMKLDASRQAFSQFLNINALLLQNLKFQEINRLAVSKILKKFDKRTSLGVSKSFSTAVHSDRLLAESVAKDVCAQVSSELVSVVPQLDDYLCPICFTVTWWPLRLACQHVFCSRCMVKMSRKGERNCPLCRADVIMRADIGSFDAKRADFLRTHFPREVKEKEKANELERNREIFGPGYTEAPCSVM